MNTNNKKIAVCFYFLLFVQFSSQICMAAESIKAPHIQISWLAPKVFGSSEELIGIQFKVDPHWHIYWKNSGDSGAPPKFNFLNPAYKVGPIQWPYPRRIPVSHLVNFGYENQAAVLFKVTPPTTETELKLDVKIEWLVCQESCIPGLAELNLKRPSRSGTSVWNADDLKTRNQFASHIPLPENEGSWKISSLKIIGNQLYLRLDSRQMAVEKDIRPLDIFPVDGEYVNPQAPKVESPNDPRDFTYIFSLAEGKLLPSSLKFVVVDGLGLSWEVEGIVDSSRTAAGLVSESEKDSNKSTSLGDTDATGFVTLLFFAFLGGVILNLMPCVLPVLSIKFLSILKTPEGQRRREAILYTVGVLTSFVTLGAVFLALRAAGSAIGWGFQLQSPVVVLALIILFWVMSLNFLGFFEFGDSITNMAGRARSASSFSTGVLAVFIAAPCTGPFMGTALGAAAVLPAVQALGIFFSLGLGLSFPFLLVSFIPALHSLMPRPGAWMERLKQFLAFPLVATVIWLMWVLGIQLGTDAWVMSSSVLLLTAMAVWFGKLKAKFGKWVGSVIAILVIASAFNYTRSIVPKANSPSSGTEIAAKIWVNYDHSLIEKARAANQMVFVDFTAAWCITCQVNKKAVLETAEVLKIFKANNVLIMQADWTNQDPEITKALAEFDRNSVPVYLFYGKNAAPAKILPQILSTRMIAELFEN